ncbi:hypothetical protein U9M48_016303 [Paspalum notatum var. saurae]|uniref:Sugar phosphate transporter domain-containing protein n=1 Tax=Paspalum notatum var. saurae TaxID=547442 RepID=A0AAQ3T604_PASNO
MTGKDASTSGGGGGKGQLLTVGLVTAWYSSNIGVLLLNKYLLSNYGFNSRLQLAKISALSLVFCASVVSGNVSLRYLPVSFNQAVGATTPFFTAVFAYLMTVKRESLLTYLALLPVVTGVITHHCKRRRAQLSSVWIHHVRGSHCCQGTEDGLAGDSHVF